MTHMTELNSLSDILGLPIKDIRIQKYKGGSDSDFFFTVDDKQVKLTGNQICVRSAFRKAIVTKTLLLPKRFSLSGWDEVIRLILKFGTSVVSSF